MSKTKYTPVVQSIPTREKQLNKLFDGTSGAKDSRNLRLNNYVVVRARNAWECLS